MKNTKFLYNPYIEICLNPFEERPILNKCSMMPGFKIVTQVDMINGQGNNYIDLTNNNKNINNNNINININSSSNNNINNIGIYLIAL